MVRVSIQSSGEKRCELIHGPSKSVIKTDAPLDNNGKGELFSPTDLVAAATGSCMLTVMDIQAERAGFKIRSSRATVDKEMGVNPRRITRLTIDIHLPQALTAEQRKMLEAAACACPVKQSLHPDTQLPVIFSYDL